MKRDFSEKKASSSGLLRGGEGFDKAERDAEEDMGEYQGKDVPRRFWKFLRRHTDLIIVAAAGNVLTVFLVMLVPLFAKLVIDEAIPGRNVGLLVGLAVSLFVLQVIRVVAGYGHEFLVSYVGQRTIFDIRRELFHHLQLLHLAFYEKKRTASLVNRVIHDAAAIQQFINTAFNTIANSLVSLLMAMGIMFLLNWKLTLFCAASLPFYFSIVHWYRAKLQVVHHDVKERQSLLAGRLGETFAGIRVVKSFAQEDHERRRFVLQIKDNFHSELRLPLLGARMNGVLGVLFFFTYSVVMVGQGLGSIWGGMSIGSYVAYTTYLWMLFVPLAGLSNLLQASTNARTGFERILWLLDTKPNIREDDNPVVLPDIQGRVQFEHVDFAYDDRPALLDFHLDVQPGEVVAIVGHSGSGKSTLMSLLTRFYDVEHGRILIDGVDLRRLKSDAYRQQLGIVLQENFLFSGTVEDNIRYGRPDAGDEDVLRAARLANALEFIEKMPEGFRSQVGQGGVTLSGGQRQRIAIARCILKNPRILIFDEATSALDNQSEALIQASMDTLMQRRTVFIVAHRLATIRRAGRIVVLDHGRIAEVGSHEELLARRGAFYELYRPKMASAREKADLENLG
ncbi:MAG: ABC transporter ATP-binding protein [Terrimicrobiaceae bacterium]